MSESKTITVFGANGQVGREFVTQALSAGHRIRAFVRDAAHYPFADHKQVKMLEGNATNAMEVAGAISESQVVCSFLGNPTNKEIRIMHTATQNIMAAAATQKNPPRCLMISSVGVGGSSWLIKAMLTLIGGKAGFLDYEAAESRVRGDLKVPFSVIRPYALNSKPGTGQYKILPGKTAHFAKPIARADVARFFLDSVLDSQWDGPSGVNIGGA